MQCYQNLRHILALTRNEMYNPGGSPWQWWCAAMHPLQLMYLHAAPPNAILAKTSLSWPWSMYPSSNSIESWPCLLVCEHWCQVLFWKSMCPWPMCCCCFVHPVKTSFLLLSCQSVPFLLETLTPVASHWMYLPDLEVPSTEIQLPQACFAAHWYRWLHHLTKMPYPSAIGKHIPQAPVTTTYHQHTRLPSPPEQEQPECPTY